MPSAPWAVSNSRFRPLAALGLALAAALLLAACQSKSARLGDNNLTTASTTLAPDTPSFKRTEALAKQWEKDPANVEVGLAYAANLEKLDQRPAQIKVLKTIADSNRTDAAIQAKIGKQLITAGAPGEAAAILERAVALNAADWQALSALGSAYDQQANHGVAREKYQAALAIKPGEPAIRNNMAMSFALQGKLPDAENILRELMNDPQSRGLPRVRQNLALVVGLQGRFDEARKIASEDLPPDQVEANLAYLKQMLSQPNTWAQLQDGQG